jgi:phenylacetate-coenzyme A ligase PaaK-like adenylate-forming protein
MHRSPCLPSAAAIPAPDAPRELLTRGPPAGSGQAPEGSGAAGSPDVIRYLTEDHDRIAQRMNDVVVHRIFAAGLDLQSALGLIGDHSGASKIYHALDELDHAIRDIRNTIFDRSPASISDQVPGLLKLRFQDSRLPSR